MLPVLGASPFFSPFIIKPIGILLDRVVQVTLKRRTGLIEGQNIKARHYLKWLLVEGAFKGCRSKEIHPPTPTQCEVQGHPPHPTPLPIFRPDSEPLTTSVIHCSSTSKSFLPPLFSLVPTDWRWTAVQIGSDSNRTLSICSVRLFLVCTVEWG